MDETCVKKEVITDRYAIYNGDSCEILPDIPSNSVCCNGDSHHCADFVNCGCKYFEREDDKKCQNEKEQRH